MLCYFFFFKQKTAYELRISDWSSDVCSSDLSAVVDRRKASAIGSVIVQDKRRNNPAAEGGAIPPPVATSINRVARTWPARSGRASSISSKIGSASCRERVCQYV